MNIDRLLTLDVHNTSVPIGTFLFIHFDLRGKSSWRFYNKQGDWRRKQFSFSLMIDASLLSKVFVMFLNQGTISSLLEPYMGKSSDSVLKAIL